MVRFRPSAALGIVGQLTIFLGISVLSGLLLAGLLIPLAGGLGLTARSAAEVVTKPGETLDVRQMAQRSRILAADGSLIADLYDENRVSVSLTKVAPIMKQAILAIEDSRFYEHGGLDVRGTMRAIATNAQSGELVQGGSTLTQQYVKNVLVTQAKTREQVVAAQDRKLGRKVRELKFALQVEDQLTKDKILENYLNITYFGSGAYGVEAAARRYFSKHASQLNLAEAALLAGLVRNPYKYSPSPKNMANTAARRNTVLDRMAELKLITPAMAAATKRTKVALKPSKTTHGCAAAKAAAWFCDYVVNTIRNDPLYGKTKADRQALLDRGGLTVRTTYDPRMQRAAQQGVNKHVYAKDRAAAAMSIVEPGTGAIKAMAQSRPYGTGGVNLNADKKQGSGAGFQAGSTFKVFVAASALQQNIPVSTTIHAPFELDASELKFRTCVNGKSGTTRDRDWKPKNESETENGPYNMASGLELSVNTYFIQLEARTGVCEPAKLAERMGLQQAHGEPLQQHGTFTLGTNPVSPLSMAEAYATFAARGKHCHAVAITKITDRNNRDLPVPPAKCDQVLKPEIADTMNALLQNVVKNGTGKNADFGRPIAGKTGTTNDRVAVWWVGYTPNMAAAVWAGSPKDYTYHMENVKIGPTFYSGGVCGGCLPAKIWRDAMRQVVADLPANGFNAPPPQMIAGQGNEVPDLRGIPASAAEAALRAAGWQVKIADGRVDSRQPADTVAFTSPNAGDRASPNSTVTIFVSRGNGTGQVFFERPGNRGNGRAGRGTGRGDPGVPELLRCQNGGTFPFCRPNP
jgi:membrane peptidoglycan carboxypeptidase